MKLRARSERCPPLNSLRLFFHTLLKATFSSRPSEKSLPSGGLSWAEVPGRSVLKISPK
jgi:hypothetical protein